MNRIIIRLIATIISVAALLTSCDKEETEILADVDDVCSVMDDQVFIDYCLREFDLDHDGKVSMQEAAQVNVMEIPSGSPFDQLHSIKGIGYFKTLTKLNLYDTQVSELDLSHNIALTMLNLGRNPISKLNVTKNLALTDLRCSYSQLTSLDISNNKALKDLNCSYNQFTKLDVSKNTALTELVCASNKLTKLDVSKNPNLSTLWCHDNRLTSLDVSKNSLLKTLYCGRQEETVTVYYSNGQPISEWSSKPTAINIDNILNTNVIWVQK